MSQAPSMPLYWDAYLADTTHLSTEEHGAYLLLLGAMWRRNGSVPDDDRDNARIVGLSPAKWRKVKTRLSVFLIFDNGGISQKKLQETWRITQEKITTNRENGALGGRPKTKKTKDLGLANGYPDDNPNVTIPEPEPEPEPESKKKERLSASLSKASEVTEAVKIWNQTAEQSGLAKCAKLTETRKSHIGARIESDGLEAWAEICAKVAASSFCRGLTDKGQWRADIDFIASESGFTKIMEGKYDDRKSAKPDPVQTRRSIWGEKIAEADGRMRDDAAPARRALPSPGRGEGPQSGASTAADVGNSFDGRNPANDIRRSEAR